MKGKCTKHGLEQKRTYLVRKKCRNRITIGPSATKSYVYIHNFWKIETEGLIHGKIKCRACQIRHFYIKIRVKCDLSNI